LAAAPKQQQAHKQGVTPALERVRLRSQLLCLPFLIGSDLYK
jgi:hypothetical protein